MRDIFGSAVAAVARAVADLPNTVCLVDYTRSTNGTSNVNFMHNGTGFQVSVVVRPDGSIAYEGSITPCKGGEVGLTFDEVAGIATATNAEGVAIGTFGADGKFMPVDAGAFAGLIDNSGLDFSNVAGGGQVTA